MQDHEARIEDEIEGGTILEQEAAERRAKRQKANEDSFIKTWEGNRARWRELGLHDASAFNIALPEPALSGSSVS